MERDRHARRLRAEILNDRLENLNHRSATLRDEFTRMEPEAPIAVKHSKRSREAAAMLLYVDAQFASPYVMAVYVSLLEKGLTFDVRPLDLFAHANQQPGFASTSITRRVPTLIHDDFSLSESSAICEYIDETFPGTRLYPTDPRNRARARQVQAWLRSDLMPIRDERPTIVVFYGVKRSPLSAAAQDAAAKLYSAALALLTDKSANLFGEWSIADVDLAMMLNRLLAHGDEVPEQLVAYATHQWQRPSVQRWVNLPRPGSGRV
jgi:glutathione S-transferase